jgi:YegS/Rv2252/BmrU family lipid kinase
MNRFFVIFNPAARGEKSRRMLKFLEARARASDGITLAPTRHAGDAKELAAGAVAQGYPVIVAAGGDGTVNEVVNGIGTSGAALGVLPLGTVNVFARELRIPLRVKNAWQVIESGHVRVIDLGRAESGDEARWFVQMAGAGFDAWAVELASWELKKKIGPLSYVWAGLKAVSDPCGRVTVTADGLTEPVEGVVALIGNGRYYGGSFPLFPNAQLDNGKLEVCVFRNSRYRDLLRYGLTAIRGRHIRLSDVTYFRTEQVECRPSSAAHVPFELDGELAGRAPVRFSVLPRALRVLAPEVN